MLKYNYKKLIIYLILVVTSLQGQDLSAGKKLINYEKYNDAQKYFISYLETANAATGCFFLGEIQFLKQNIDSAKLYYLSGIKANDKLSNNYAGMVKINLYQNNISEVEFYENKAIETGKDKSETFLFLAEAFMVTRIKDYDKALIFIDRGLKLNSKSSDLYILLGKLHLEKANGSEAIKNYEKALEFDKDNYEAICCKANVYSLINNYEEAIQLLKKALTINPDYSPAYNALAEIYAAVKDYNNALYNYKKYLEASENTPEKLKRYASLLFMNKDYKQAITVLEENESAQKDIVSSTRILAYSYLNSSLTEKSLFYFKKLFDIPSTEYLPTDYENYSDLLSRTGNDSLAIEYLNKLVTIDSSRSDIWGKISVLNYKKKNWDGVINALEKKKQLTGQEYFDMGKACIFKGDENINNVLVNLSSLLKLNDNQTYDLKTALLIYQKNLRDADKDSIKIKAALDKVLYNVESSINTSQKTKWAETKKTWIKLVRQKIGTEYGKADSAFKMLTEKTPNLALSYLWRARVNTNFDPESEAGISKPFYEEFIRLAGSETDKYKKELIEAYSYLGYYYYLQKDESKSKSYWLQVLQLDPENKQANDVVKQLK